MPRLADQSLKHAVFQEVAVLVRTVGQGFPVVDVVQQFIDKGVHEATLYRWVKQAVQAVPADKVARTKSHTGPRKRAGRKPLEPARLADPEPVTGNSAIPYEADIRDSLNRLRIMLTMSEGDDGKVRNVRLALAAIDQVGRTLARAAKIQDTISASQQTDVNKRQEAFMAGLVRVIMEEDKPVRDRIIGKLQALRLSYGAMT